jgi:hypothetical protein
MEQRSSVRQRILPLLVVIGFLIAGVIGGLAGASLAERAGSRHVDGLDCGDGSG